MSRRAPDPGTSVVIKIGSSSLGRLGAGLDPAAIEAAVEQVEVAWANGHPAVLVTSGAVAAGLPALGLTERPRDVIGLQVAAAVGQGRLMHEYIAAFARRGRVAGQVLLTKAILSDRDQYLHARQALDRMLAEGIVPVVNENDTVVVDELRMGDNDRLAAVVSHLVDASLLVLLTDTDGLLSGDPRADDDVELVGLVAHNDDALDRLARGGKGPLGSGGVASKVAAARIAAFSGIPTIIGPSFRSDVTSLALSGGEIGTWIEPREKRLTARKLWIAFGQPSAGSITVDDGARHALIHMERSLLPVGVVSVKGDFVAADAVEIFDSAGGLIAKGITRFPAGALRLQLGQRSDDGEAINRDDLVILVDG